MVSWHANWPRGSVRRRAYAVKCDICGAKFPMFKMRRDGAKRLVCPDEGNGRDEVTLTQANMDAYVPHEPGQFDGGNVSVDTLEPIPGPIIPSAEFEVPEITDQPDNVDVAEGLTANFSVVATGTEPLSYQWQLDSGAGFSNIFGATSSSYTTGALTLADDGNEYRCVVSNAGGDVTSNAAVLTVGDIPQVTVQPSNATVEALINSAITFSVTATGDPVLTYQWQKNTGSGYANISGATAATLDSSDEAVLAASACPFASNGHLYRCVVTNSYGSVNSDPATLTVSWTPKELGTATCRDWHRSDMGVTLNGSGVSAWMDQSGNGNSIVQGVAAAQPTFSSSVAALNNQAAADYDGGDSLAIADLAGADLTTFTVYVVVTAPPDDAALRCVFDNNDAAPRSSFFFFGGFEVGLYDGVTNLASGAASYSANVKLAMRGFFQDNAGGNSAGRVLRDGVADVTWSGALNDNPGLAGFTLGALFPPVNNWDGHIAEVIILNGDFTASENANLIPYLRARYDIEP